MKRIKDRIGLKVIIAIILVTILLLLLDIINITNYIKLSTNYDWLAYIGAIIGGLLTLGGVYLTIKFEREKQKRELSIMYKPIIEPLVYAKDMIEGSNIGIIIAQKDCDNSNRRECLKFSLKNKGRGETKNLQITDIKIIDSPSNCNFILEEKTKEENDINEVLCDGYIIINILLPDNIYTKYKEKIYGDLKIEVSIKYNDIFEYNEYISHFILTINVDSPRGKVVNVETDKGKISCHKPIYKKDSIILVKNEYKERVNEEY